MATTHGWVMPGYGARHFAVCWNGLVYPVASVGAPADLKADVAEAVARGRLPWDCYPESEAVSWKTPNELGGFLLLRLGETKLAEDFWKTARAYRAKENLRDPIGTNLLKIPADDPYAFAAAQWMWSLFDRTVCAHIRGDDVLALAGARDLQRLRAGVAAEILRHAGQPGADGGLVNGLPVGREMPLYFLDPVEQLLADQERRAARAVRPSALEQIRNPALTADERIRILIDSLDEVAVHQWGQPGGLEDPISAPIVKAIIAEGPRAIPELLKCMESGDVDHLIRAVSYGRDFLPGRTLHTVRLPLRSALLALMDASYDAVGIRYGHMDLPGREEAAVFHAYWSRYGQTAGPERWYRLLADDAAKPGGWMDAAKSIMKRDADKAFAGEVLRQKANPSVTELLVKRLGTIAIREQTEKQTDLIGADSREFGLVALDWEPAALLPAVTQLMRKEAGEGSRASYHCMSRLAIARANHGDLAALDEWAEWIQKLQPESLKGFERLTCAPLYRFPDHPASRRMAAALFKDAGTLQLWNFGVSDGDRLLVIPEVRSLWIERLKNLTQDGTAEVKKDGTWDVSTGHGGYGSSGDAETKKLPVGTRQVNRTCDSCAFRLSEVPGMPAFHPMWEESRRDEVIRRMIALLERNGHLLRCDGPEEVFFSSGVRFEFPARTLPATEADLEHGDAIFCAPGGTDARAVPLPSRPLAATLADGSQVLIWQAEEWMESGKMQRYYGIVNRHSIRRIPAEEVRIK
ncbi:MAG: hypothetical protein QM755_03145 [Luteolibacter sp.]